MRETRPAVTLLLGGALCGGLLGIVGGALLLSAYGALVGNIALGLDGAIFGGVLLSLGGAAYGLTVWLVDWRQRRYAEREKASADRCAVD
jgi:hypothetical protein